MYCSTSFISCLIASLVSVEPDVVVAVTVYSASRASRRSFLILSASFINEATSASI